MTTLPGLKKLASAIDALKAVAEEFKEILETKQDWLSEKSDSYQDSDKGQEWSEHLDAVESLLSDIENLEIPE